MLRVLRLSASYKGRGKPTIEAVIKSESGNNVTSGWLSQRFSSTTSEPTFAQEDETIILSNGHTLGYSVCGSHSCSAPTIFFLHGYPSCRLEGLGVKQAAKEVGVRIITPDRPGLGLSTYDPHRTFLDYPDHIAQLARYHGLSEYRVIGGSGGAPYALACAKSLPTQHLKGLGVLAGVGPMDPGMGREEMRATSRVFMRINQWAPGLLRWVLERLLMPKLQNPDTGAIREFLQNRLKRAKLEESERQYLELEKIDIDMIIRVLQEHFRQGTNGFMTESQLYLKPWGFRLEDVPFEGVRLWYGANDKNTPIKMGVEMSKRLKHAKLKIYADDTHFTVAKYVKEILKEILEDPLAHITHDPQIEITGKEKEAPKH
ncbi:MAG: hypothetical protein M1836_002829 [Candelina mexicana]|nr:MAG: hypothetical protein M1836_002829 [Candelina mexicana]